MMGMSSMTDLFDKMKLAAGNLPNNETEMAPGRMQMREDTTGRATSGLGHPWGEGPLNNDSPPEYSTAIEREIDEGRGKLLGRVFEGMPGMVAADKALITELFSNFRSEATTSHSPLLQKKASHEPPPTLAERIQRLR